MAQAEYLVILERFGPRAYGAYVPELPGIGVAEETEGQVRDLVVDAIRLYRDELERDGCTVDSVVVNHYTVTV